MLILCALKFKFYNRLKIELRFSMKKVAKIYSKETSSDVSLVDLCYLRFTVRAQRNGADLLSISQRRKVERLLQISQRQRRI